MALDLKKIIEESCKTASTITESAVEETEQEIQEVDGPKTGEDGLVGGIVKSARKGVGDALKGVDNTVGKGIRDFADNVSKIPSNVSKDYQNFKSKMNVASTKERSLSPDRIADVQGKGVPNLVGPPDPEKTSFLSDHPYAAGAGAAITAGLGALALRKKMAKMKK